MQRKREGERERETVRDGERVRDGAYFCCISTLYLYCILFTLILCFSTAAGLLQQTNFSYGGLLLLTFIYPGKQIKNCILIFKCSLKRARSSSSGSGRGVLKVKTRLYKLHSQCNIVQYNTIKQLISRT